MNLDEHFAAAIADWRQSDEARELVRLKTEHRAAKARLRCCKESLAEHEGKVAATQRHQRHDEVERAAAGRSKAEAEHARAVTAEREAAASRTVCGARQAARDSLLARLRVAAVRAAVKVGLPDGLPWSACGRLTEQAILARADVALANLGHGETGEPHHGD